MLTQCPHCLTLFRVGPEHLKAAAGQVRCCRCHQVFNALESLREKPASFDNDALPEEGEAAQETLHGHDLETAHEASPDEDSQITEPSEWLDFKEQQAEEEFKPLLPAMDEGEQAEEFLEDILEQDDGLDPEPEYFAEGSESQMSELLDQDSSSILLPDSETPPEPVDQAASDNIIDFSVLATPPSTEQEPEMQREQEIEPQPEREAFEDSILKDEAIDEELGKPDYDSVPAMRNEDEVPLEPAVDDERVYRFEATETRRPHKKSAPVWLIGSLLLTLLLAAQLTWQFRNSLIHYEAGRQTLDLLCAIAQCKVPVRRDLNKIVIQGRNLSTHPDKSDTLFLQLSIVNTAAYEQPFPQLTLSLYNDMGNLIARRTFTTDNYLPDAYAQRQLMPKAQAVLVEMELVDPGKQVTGFSFDFH